MHSWSTLPLSKYTTSPHHQPHPSSWPCPSSSHSGVGQWSTYATPTWSSTEPKFKRIVAIRWRATDARSMNYAWTHWWWSASVRAIKIIGRMCGISLSPLLPMTGYIRLVARIARIGHVSKCSGCMTWRKATGSPWTCSTQKTRTSACVKLCPSAAAKCS